MKDEDQVLPWACESCGHTLKDSPFITYECCPECDSEAFYHGSIESVIHIHDLAQDEDGEDVYLNHDPISAMAKREQERRRQMLTPKWNEEIKAEVEKHIIDGRDSKLTLEELAVPWMEWTIAMFAEIQSLQQQNKQLIEALNFYAREDIYEIQEGEYYSQIWVDEGFKARHAIQGGTSNGTSNNND